MARACIVKLGYFPETVAVLCIFTTVRYHKNIMEAFNHVYQRSNGTLYGT